MTLARFSLATYYIFRIANLRLRELSNDCSKLVLWPAFDFHSFQTNIVPIDSYSTQMVNLTQQGRARNLDCKSKVVSIRSRIPNPIEGL